MSLLLPGVPDPLPDDQPYRERRSWWTGEDAAADHRRGLALVANLALEQPKPPGEGVGVVYVGGGRYWPMMLTGLHMLRASGHDWPVEVWHRGESEAVDTAALATLGDVTVRDAEAEAATRGDRRFSHGRAGGWGTKLYALVHSKFETAVFLDADAYAVASLEPVAEAARTTGGFAHWLDIPGHRDNVKWPIVWPAGPNRTTSFQGGQYAVHRPGAWRELLIAKWMCDHADFYFERRFHVFGDQDCIRVAHALTGKRTAVVGKAAWQHPAYVAYVGETPTVVHRIGGKMFRPQEGGRNDPNYALPREDQAWSFFAKATSDAAGLDAKTVFTACYDRHIWGGGSGAGSTGKWVESTAAIVNAFMASHGWTKLVDAGCGDGVVASALWAPQYTGVDVVPHLIAKNRKKWPNRVWVEGDFCADLDVLPDGDLLLVRDVLNHMPNSAIVSFVSAVRRAGRWKAALFIQDAEQRYDGADTHLGGHRGLDPAYYPLRDLGLTEIATLWSKRVLLWRHPNP